VDDPFAAPETEIEDTPRSVSLRLVLPSALGHGGALLVENPLAAPFAFAPATTIVTGSEAAARAVIAEPGFDPHTMTVLERPQAGLRAGDSMVWSQGSVAVAKRSNAEVVLHTSLAGRGLVVLNESLMEGWRVRIDGRPAPTVRVNTVMRGVIVPAGRHRVDWRYTVPGLRAGLLVSLLSAIGTAIWFTIAVVRRRRLARDRPHPLAQSVRGSTM